MILALNIKRVISVPLHTRRWTINLELKTQN